MKENDFYNDILLYKYFFNITDINYEYAYIDVLYFGEEKTILTDTILPDDDVDLLNRLGWDILKTMQSDLGWKFKYKVVSDLNFRSNYNLLIPLVIKIANEFPDYYWGSEHNVSENMAMLRYGAVYDACVNLVRNIKKT